MSTSSSSAVEREQKKESIVICEHSPKVDIQKNILWRTIDIRDYGQSRLTFLVYV